MARLIAFELVSVDGYFVDARGDMRWAHDQAPDPGFDAFVRANAEGGGTLVFGRVTYEMMASYWPTPLAAKQNPVVAERMNTGRKIVFSRTLETADWQNTTLVRGELVEETRRLKAASETGLAIMGSGNLVAQLTAAGLIDAWQLVVVPLILGAGRTPFDGVGGRVAVKRAACRAFDNGNVFLEYVPAS